MSENEQPENMFSPLEVVIAIIVFLWVCISTGVLSNANKPLPNNGAGAGDVRGPVAGEGVPGPNEPSVNQPDDSQ